MRKSSITMIPLLLLASCAAHSAPVSAGRNPAAAETAEQKYARLVQAAGKYSELGRPQSAVKVADQARELNPKRPEAYAALGFAHAQLNDLPKSASFYETARRHGARDRKVFDILASVYEMSQQYAKAEEVYQSYLDKNPGDALMRQQLGLCLLLQGRPMVAITHLQKALTTAPGNTNIKADLGYALARGGKTTEAIALFREVFSPTAGTPMPEEMLLEVIPTLESVEEALKLVEDFAPRPHSARVIRVIQRLRSMRSAE